MFLVIFWRFAPFSRDFQNVPKDQTNLSEHFLKISVVFQRFPKVRLIVKIVPDFQRRLEDV